MRRRVAARRLASEDGFTLIELLIAMTVTAVGLMALVSSFDHSRNLVSLAEKTEVATHRAERQMEQVLALPYGQIAHRIPPVNDPDPASPANYVSGLNYQWDQGPTGPRSEILRVDAVNGSTLLDVTPWQDSESRLQGEVHTFATQTGDLCPTYTPPSGGPQRCTGTERGTRVTVAVTVDGPRPLRRPVLISAVITDPNSTG
jgi:prepilin-type N-terminal cleavage/methylation domain-containing protein